MSWSAYLGTVVALVAGCYLLEGLILSKSDAQEPPYIRPSIPLIGHLLDYLKKGTFYFTDVEYAVHQKLYTHRGSHRHETLADIS